jgi:RHS repeat-associated protein
LDNAGNRTAKTDQRTAVATSYGYDNIYQLLSATQGATTTESYAYDPVGNRTSSLGVSSYSTNSSNQLTASSNATYTYDNNGNTLTKAVESNTTTYAWDYENRFTSVTLPGSGGTVSYRYDPFGRRIYKSSSAGTSVYAYDGYNLIEETNSSGTAVARYTQTQNIDEPLAELRSGGTSYYEVDGLGSVTSLTSSAGEVANTYTYDSFGNLTASTGTLSNPFRYTAREFDTETNLYFYRARYYDQSTGRFIAEDPIEFDGGKNFYRYVGNNPISRTDPRGLRVTWYGAFRDDDVPGPEKACYNDCTQRLDVIPALAGIWGGATSGLAAGVVLGSPALGVGAVPGAVIGTVIGTAGGYLGHLSDGIFY